jgi:undecaprenyl diphosphate synthase
MGEHQPARYVAIITDGNARWAAKRGLQLIDGYRAGAENVRARLRDAADLGVEQLTIYAFSTENWARSTQEIIGLMNVFREYVSRETPNLHAEGVRMKFIGRRAHPVPDDILGLMGWAEQLTAENGRITFFIPFNYGGRAEILDAARTFTGTTEDDFRRHLYAPDLHDPDLIIRTSGEQRLSNYLLWQAAYAELVFRQELWPDFARACLEDTLAEFQHRSRRRGGRAT